MPTPESGILGLLHVKVKVGVDVDESADVAEGVVGPSHSRTLMELNREEIHVPQLKYPGKKELIQRYLETGNNDLLSAIQLSQSLQKLNGKSLLHDALIIKCSIQISGVRNQDLEDFKYLLLSVSELLWYLAPHEHKLSSRSCPIPSFFKHMTSFNDPKSHKHSPGRIQRDKVDLLIGAVTTQLEKSYVHRTHFYAIKEEVDKLVEAAVKYCDFLDNTLISMAASAEDDQEPTYEQKVWKLPFDKEAPYGISRERKAVDTIVDELRKCDFFQPISINEIFPENRSLRYTFIKHMIKKGIELENCVLFSQNYKGNKGNIYFIWKEDASLENEQATLRNTTINAITAKLPKYFSRGHKQRMKALTENLVYDKISTAEFRAIYSELTGDESKGSNRTEREIDNRLKLIMHNLTPQLAKDLRVNNARKGKFDQFWDICQKVISDLTAVDDRRHGPASENGDVVVNMAVAISAPQLYDKCKIEALKTLQEEDIPSLSWFKFQFWPKNTRENAAMNYTGRFKIRYMMQQRMLRKQHDDEHYCACIYKYLRSMAVSLRDVSAMICTDDKHKISCGEPNYPLSALPRGRRVIVAQNEYYRVGDHDFSRLSFIPTVFLMNEIPDDVSSSWYRGKPHVMLKIAALEPSTALRNARETADILIEHYGAENVPPVLFLYTDGGPEHRTNFLSVKIAMIALKKFLNLDLLVAARTAPGHSFRNPAEKINCILNLGLYGIGIMRKASNDVEFEHELCKCSNLAEIRAFLDKSPEKNATLLRESCSYPLDLIKSNFAQLKLKDEQFVCQQHATDEQVSELFSGINLDATLEAHSTGSKYEVFANVETIFVSLLSRAHLFFFY